MENKEKILNALTDLIVRTANKENATPEELRALTKAASVTLSYYDNDLPDYDYPEIKPIKLDEAVSNFSQALRNIQKGPH
ncbi:MAG: hypothetical protein LKJ75_02395 [Clostridia bacterium]|jgi:hypothetical protein|nr:hypothetical protein [Clostridia bacterium]MCI2014033.1 hypothetical protein [Clostridia bacterium]